VKEFLAATWYDIRTTFSVKVIGRTCESYRALVHKLTPNRIKLKRKRTAWMETLLYKPERYQEFYTKFGRFEDVWLSYICDGLTGRDAERQISNWMLNDLFDKAVVGQLNDDNLLRHLFKNYTPKFTSRKYKVKKTKKKRRK
jgi:hypothetical protein